MKKLFEKYREIITYVIFGGLTTVVNYVIYFPLRRININYEAATFIAWLGAVLFAYAVNRAFVFKSKAKGKAALREFLLFVGARVFSYGAEALTMYIFMDVINVDRFVLSVSFFENPLPVGEFGAKTIAQIIIIILNYLFSKLVIFRKKK